MQNICGVKEIKIPDVSNNKNMAHFQITDKTGKYVE